MKRLPAVASFAAVFLALPLCAIAQAVQQEVAPPPAECIAALSRPFDGGLDPRIEPDCDSTAFYYGIGRDRDYDAAKSCALIERINHVEAKDGSPFPGAGILSMIYANGDGTPRDINLAKRFVCENKEAATSETAARLQVLDNIAKTPQTAGRYSLCGVATTSLTLGWCASLQLRVADGKRYDEMVKIVDKLSPAGVEAFKKLQAAEGDYEAARSQKEIDLTGGARRVGAAGAGPRTHAVRQRPEALLHAQLLAAGDAGHGGRANQQGLHQCARERGEDIPGHHHHRRGRG